MDPRHLARRSPIPPFDPISKKLILKKKLLKKLLIKSPKLVPIGKKMAKFGAVGLAGSSLPALPELGVIGLVGGATGGAGAVFGPPIARQLSSAFG